MWDTLKNVFNQILDDYVEMKIKLIINETEESNNNF